MASFLPLCSVPALAPFQRPRACTVRARARPPIAGRPAGDGLVQAQGAVHRRVFMGALIVGAPLAPLRAGAQGGAAGSDRVVELDPSNWAAVMARPGRVFVEMYAPWCPFCQRLDPLWSRLPQELAAQRVGGVTVARMDVDKHTDYAARFGVSGFPTLILFEAGRPLGVHQGMASMEQLLRYASGATAAPATGGEGAGGPGGGLDLVLSDSAQRAAREQLGALRGDLAALGDGARAAALRRVETLESLLSLTPALL